ncbi:MAG: hypothetical protein JNM70_18780 [Anaerolineae bacterium]|nr:hypothetical protein [Anaerolineae bacterium]
MKTLRRWQLDSASPVCLTLAADARYSSTDYLDDQIWEVVLKTGESPGLALQTRYGGRVGLASLVPMWFHDGRPIYQAQAYAKPPYVTAFAPGYIRIQAALTSQLALQAEYWAMESHTVGAKFTFANAHVDLTRVRIDLIGFVASLGKEQRTEVIRLSDGSSALSLGKVGDIKPIVLLEGSQSAADGVGLENHKLSAEITIPGRKKAIARFVHAARPHAGDSVALAQKWLMAEWDEAFKQIAAGADSIPEIETGDEETDATIAFAWKELVQSFLKPTASLPNASFVSTRQPAHGFNNAADRGWKGQSVQHSYLAGLAAASISPKLAQGLIQNYLALQQPDGWIDARPGLNGQKQGELAAPLLARLSWGIFQYTEDSEFIREAFPKLRLFFNRWLKPDMDRDADGLAEWQSEAQSGFVYNPTFASWQGWGGGADIRCVESPDLAAYLLSEAYSLREMAYFLRDTAAEGELNSRISDLEKGLESLWNEALGRYAYRDFQSHQTLSSIPIITDARAGEELFPSASLPQPNRIVIRISGGVNLLPRMTLQIDGIDAAGQQISETATGEQFTWAGGRGVYTTRNLYAQVDRIQASGLSRVYRIDAHSVDLTRLDINALVPLWTPGCPAEHAERLIKLLTDPQHFWRESGVAMNSGMDSLFDPSNANGSGAVWPYWLTLTGEGLIESGHVEIATEVLRRLIRVQVQVLKDQKSFSEFYHSDQPKGLGEAGHLSGIIPLHLLMRTLGVRVISAGKVWVGGRFRWDVPITIRHHGVTVVRSAEGTRISFPSGYETSVSGEEWQEVIDPHG